MRFVDKAVRGASRGFSGIRKLATANNANKLLTGFNYGLKSLGDVARTGSQKYNTAVSNNLIPSTNIGTNVDNTLKTLGKLQ